MIGRTTLPGHYLDAACIILFWLIGAFLDLEFCLEGLFKHAVLKYSKVYKAIVNEWGEKEKNGKYSFKSLKKGKSPLPDLNQQPFGYG